LCGRYTLKTAPDQWGQILLPLLDVAPLAGWQPRYNIAPTQPIVAVARGASGGPTVDYYRWGLVPFWADSLAIGSGMINARVETVGEKPAFRAALAKRRCAIVADGYYEWQPRAEGKQPYWIHLPDSRPFVFAGLWESNRKATGDPILTATILTTAASQSMSALHHRMPMVLPPDQIAAWIDPNLGGSEARELALAASQPEFVWQPVSKYVNSPRHDDPDCLAPAVAD
jgi:putative SOS response-associated peptidase YedK